MKKVFILLLIATFIISCSSSNEPEQRKPKTSIEISKTKPNDLIPLDVGNWWEYIYQSNKVKWEVKEHLGLQQWSGEEFDTWLIDANGDNIFIGVDNNKEIVVGYISKKWDSVDDFRTNSNNFNYIDKRMWQTEFGVTECVYYEEKNNNSNKTAVYFKKGLGMLFKGFNNIPTWKLIDYEIK